MRVKTCPSDRALGIGSGGRVPDRHTKKAGVARRLFSFRTLRPLFRIAARQRLRHLEMILQRRQRHARERLEIRIATRRRLLVEKRDRFLVILDHLLGIRLVERIAAKLAA